MVNRRFKGRGLGKNQKRALLLLLAGVALAFTRSPKGYRRIIKGLSKGWQEINARALQKVIKSLYKAQLVEEKFHPDGRASTIVLSKKGKEKALTFQIDNLKIKKPTKWDKKWRVVIFDVPEKRRKARDAFRSILKRAGFYDLQKSVLICPYEWWDEVDYAIEFFRLRPYVRTLTADSVDNELHFKKIFKLS